MLFLLQAVAQTRDVMLEYRGSNPKCGLVNDHPEMKGLDPDEESLFVFESDVSLKAFVLNNDEPGKNEPFYVTEEDLDQD